MTTGVPTRAPGPLLPAAGACLALAVVSLVLPASIAFDPWAWLVWGREVLHADLDTAGGPSWKPLPVLVTTPLALLGGLAPTAWLVLARTAGLLAVVLAFRLARRLGGAAAGLIAAVGLLLTPDGGPRFLRLVAEGHSAPAEAALALWAVDSHLDGRVRRTLVALTALALLRPEAWPFLGLYALWAWRRHPEHRALSVALVASIPVLWFGGDWWGAGNPLEGASDAQVIDDPAGTRLLEGLDHMAKVVVLPLWVGVGAAVWTDRQAGERRLIALTAAALAWMGIVVAMGVGLRYAALSRFLLPAGALLCVVGAVGLVRLVTRTRPGRPRGVVAAGLVVLALVFVTPRVTMGPLLAEIADRDEIEEDLVDIVDAAGGAEAVTACGTVVADPTHLPQTVLAWQLDVPLGAVTRRPPSGHYVAVVGTGGRVERSVREAAPDASVLAAGDRWTVLAVRCPAATAG